MESCEGYINHSVPLERGETVINIETSKPLDFQYLIDQLNAEFRCLGEEDSVVKKIIQK